MTLAFFQHKAFFQEQFWLDEGLVWFYFVVVEWGRGMRGRRAVMHAAFVLLISLNSDYVCELNMYPLILLTEWTGFAFMHIILKCIWNCRLDALCNNLFYSHHKIQSLWRKASTELKWDVCCYWKAFLYKNIFSLTGIWDHLQALNSEK